MPRPKVISYEKRVTVFLAYRRSGGKINPVANQYGIARSTVRVIVKEFTDMGFSEKPRAKVSPVWLMEMQEQHIANLAGKHGIGLSGSSDAGFGNLNLGPGTDDEAARQEAIAEPLPVTEESLWHLKGTTAEHVIQEAWGGARDYLQRDSEAWQVLRLALEEACELPEREGAIDQDPGPHLLPALKRSLRRAFFDREFRSRPPPPSWLEWDQAPEDPRVLRLRNQPVGTGSPEEQLRIKEAVAVFLVNAFREHQRRFSEVERLRRDMMLMGGIVHDTLRAITEDDVRQGICPACPYPEAGLEPNTGRGVSKRLPKEEVTHE